MRSKYGSSGPATVREIDAMVSETVRAAPSDCRAPNQYNPYVNPPRTNSTGSTRRRGSGMPMGLAIGTSRAVALFVGVARLSTIFAIVG